MRPLYFTDVVTELREVQVFAQGYTANQFFNGELGPVSFLLLILSDPGPQEGEEGE